MVIRGGGAGGGANYRVGDELEDVRTTLHAENTRSIVK